LPVNVSRILALVFDLAIVVDDFLLVKAGEQVFEQVEGDLHNIEVDLGEALAHRYEVKKVHVLFSLNDQKLKHVEHDLDVIDELVRALSLQQTAILSGEVLLDLVCHLADILAPFFEDGLGDVRLGLHHEQVHL
jgi:hypothetical protein